ncbi:phytoene desaturase family protein [Streptacidiphilus cavernicola]|uniref:Phytoene desaturase family protein n=1 Tax=Streptacidiphilus cavernicola TaxID=3342716 RepID=A0ABV6VXI7_9ACTN
MASRSDTSGRDYDAVVVGGGMGGLVCAAYLAVAGRRVLLAEQHDVVGGNSQVFRRRRRYEFDVGVHYLGDCGPDGILPAILSGLGAAGRIGFRPMDRDGFDRLLLPGLAVDVPVGWDRYRERLTAALPGEAAGITRCLAVLRAAAEDLRGKLTGRWQPGDAAHRELLLHSPGTLGALFARWGLSPRAATLLAAQSGNYGSPPSRTQVVVHAAMLDHYLRGAYYPLGGGQMLPATLVEVIEAHGGTVRTRCPVERIAVGDDRRVRGVLLAGGESVRAPVVVSNADYRSTVLTLCQPSVFPASVVSRTEAAGSRAAVAVVYLALDRPLELPNANLWCWADDDVERCYARALAPAADGTAADGGQAAEVPFAFLSFASLKDPGNPLVCPPGHSNFQVMTLVPPDDGRELAGYRRDRDYLAAKARLTNALLDAAEQAVGPFRDRITHQESATARTNRRYTGSGSGSPYGLDHWGGPGRRPDVRTSVEGLYVTGRDTRHQAGIAGTAVGGITAAGHVLGRPGLLPEVYAGAVLGDPDLLPRRGADFDPLRVSRGLARRDARGLARIDPPVLAGRPGRPG